MTVFPQVRVGRAAVYVSGTVICRPGQIIEITPVPAPSGAFRIRLSFVENPFAPSGVAVQNEPNNSVLVAVTNFGNFPTSTTAPVSVGLLNGVPLMLDIAGYTTGSGESIVRAVTFTVFEGLP